MRKTIYEIINNNTGEVIKTFLFPVSVFVRSETAHEILHDRTGEIIDSFSFSIRVRVRLADIDEYKKTHILFYKSG